MLLVILALAWVALLTPVAVRKIRELTAERSIDDFHTEHEVLSRQGYRIEPAYRLAEPERPYAEPASDPWAGRAPEMARREAGAPLDAPRPRLTVVREDDTYRSLESRRTWQEWSEDYDFDRSETSRTEPMNRYASAYSSVPREIDESLAYDAPVRASRSMRRRRRVMVTRLALVTAIVSVAAFTSGLSILLDLAVLTWLVDASYLALALFALSQGYIGQAPATSSRRGVTGVAATVPYEYERYDEYGRDDEPDRGVGVRAAQWGTPYGESYEEPDREAQWGRASQARYALG